MVIPPDLKKKFSEIVEINDFIWALVDKVAVSDPNVLRPIKGVCFETLFNLTVSKYMTDKNIKLGKGDEDVDIYLNEIGLQLKTPAKGSTKKNKVVGVSLHKTHGREKRPDNLYSFDDQVFDFLVLFHPENGILIIPFEEIPKNNNWPGYLRDPAIFDWNSIWKNRWDLIGFPEYKGKTLESREIPENSELPHLSKETYLKDYEIIETLCKPEYFRAAVMGLKGNMKENWIIELLKEKGYLISLPEGSYPKYDFKVKNKLENEYLVQVKGTSKNMCDISKKLIGVEVMGTHGRFPKRGYHKSDFNYLALIISHSQLNRQYNLSKDLHFVFIPTSDLPLHYLIGIGDENINSGWKNSRWNLTGNNDIIYPNIKLITEFNKELDKVVLKPCISCYRKYKGFKTLPINSEFRNAGPYILDEIPIEFK